MGDYTDTLYCCGTDYNCEQPEDIEWFSFIDNLKSCKPCWKECGIIEVILGPDGTELFSTPIETGKFNEKK